MFVCPFRTVRRSLNFPAAIIKIPINIKYIVYLVRLSVRHSTNDIYAKGFVIISLIFSFFFRKKIFNICKNVLQMISNSFATIVRNCDF